MRPAAAIKAPRAARGTPEQTRERVVAAAATEFEAHGYHGTDSNRIARAAGYAPGTFYKHFEDKRAVFLAVYDAWVGEELATVEGLDTPAAIIDYLLGHHRRWKGFRASLRALIATDPAVRAHHRRARKQQVERIRARAPFLDATGAALLMLQLERIADALADGELIALGGDRDRAREALIALVAPPLAAATAGV